MNFVDMTEKMCIDKLLIGSVLASLQTVEGFVKTQKHYKALSMGFR